MKTDQEIRQLVLDIQGGRVFTHSQIPEGTDPSMVFMVLALMDEKAHDQLEAADSGMLYEYISAAGPRACNGMPIFMSMRHLSKADTKRVNTELQKLASFVETGETNAD